MFFALGDDQKSSSRQGLEGFLDEVSLECERTEDRGGILRGCFMLMTLHFIKSLESPHAPLDSVCKGWRSLA